MPKFLPDPTGRFAKRIYFTNTELEDIATKLANQAGSSTDQPFLTEHQITTFIEKTVDTLDLYGRLPDHIEGCTEFLRDGQTVVTISATLSENPRAVNRFRTTLTHELAHAIVHGRLFLAKQQQLTLFETPPSEVMECHRSNIIDAPSSDWLEWQAGFLSVAILAPKSYVMALKSEMTEDGLIPDRLIYSSTHLQTFLQACQDQFMISQQAAEIRVRTLGLVSPSPQRELRL